MPELPEVENVIRSLQHVVGTPIVRGKLSAVAPLTHCTATNVRKALSDTKITQLSRRGKFIIARLASEQHLVVHLGMSGQWRLFAEDEAAPKHTHMDIELGDGQHLRFVDPRRFGNITLIGKDPNAHPSLAKLGPEFDDPHLCAEQYIARMRRHNKLTVKAALLHQGIVPGLGNIYACEALYLAKIDPRRRVHECRDKELSTLLDALRKTLELGIESGGTTLKDYLNGLGHRGEMQNLLQVYDRDGQRTLDGRAEVTRIVQQGRSTWFAPAVQK